MMRPVFALTAVLLTGVLSGCEKSAAGPAPAAEPAGTAHRGAPERRSGWWEFTSKTDAGRSLGTQGLCVSKDTEARFSAFDQITQDQLLGYKCSRADFKPAASGWTFDTACDTGISADLGGGVVTSKGTITGDLHTQYEIRMAVTQAGETNKGTVTAAWKGACPAGHKPGDLAVDGTTTLNVLQN